MDHLHLLNLSAEAVDEWLATHPWTQYPVAVLLFGIPLVLLWGLTRV